MAQTLFTIGYEKRSLADYLAILEDAAIDVVIDVRETAWSHKPGFSKAALSEGLEDAGIAYVHASFAGNPKWLRELAEDHADCIANFRRYLSTLPWVQTEFERLVSSYLALGKRVALTCFERHPGDCHRGVLADNWSTDGSRRVKHLAVDGCARLICT